MVISLELGLVQYIEEVMLITVKIHRFDAPEYKT